MPLSFSHLNFSVSLCPCSRHVTMGLDFGHLRWLPLTLLLVTVVVLLPSFCRGESYQQEMLLTEDQQEGFDKFKKKALPLIPNEWMKKEVCLIKYYKSSDMDHKKALEKLKDNLKFRAEYDLDGTGALLLTTDEWEEYIEEYPLITSKTFDREGRRIGFIKFKHWDMAKATSSPENMKKFLTFAFIQLDKGYRQVIEMADDNHAAGFVMLVDMKDTEYMKHLCMPCQMFTKDSVGVIDTRWPNGLQWFPIVNLNNAIKQSVDVVFQNFIPQKVLNMSQFFDEDVANWKKELDKRIAPDQYPKKLFMDKTGQNGAAPQGPNPGQVLFGLNGLPQPPQGGEKKEEADDEEEAKPKKKSKKKKKKKDDDD